MTMKKKQAILFASFGVADSAARRETLDATAAEIAAAFPDYEVCQAYTSNVIRRRMMASGCPAPSVSEKLGELAELGYERVLVQPSLLSPGEEYGNKLLPLMPEFRERFRAFRMGEPLLFRQGKEAGGPDDYAVAAQALLACFPPETGEQLVLLGHGSPHSHNPAYELLQECADRMGLPIHVGVVEDTDTPGFRDVLGRLERHRAGCVLLAPLLIAGGVHVTEDMAGSKDSSWKRRLQAAGISVRVNQKGLGCFPPFRALYVQKVRALAQDL